MHRDDPERDAHHAWWKAQAIALGAVVSLSALAALAALAASVRRLGVRKT